MGWLLAHMVEQRWRCICVLPDGTIETTFWITQDGADQMESETEQAFPGALCTVEPVDLEDSDGTTPTAD
jgi:hypothetical protein